LPWLVEPAGTNKEDGDLTKCFKTLPSKKGFKICCHCQQEKPLSEFDIEKAKSDGHKGRYKLCASIYRKAHYISALSVAKTKKWRQAHYSKSLDYMLQYRTKLKTQIVAGYGGKCTCCGESEITFLTLEHLNNDGDEHRKQYGGGSGVYRNVIRRSFPKEYTILCYNCNLAKRGGKQCPHQMNK